MAFLKWIGILVGVLVLAFVCLLIGARFADGPLAIVAGGEFTSGELYSGPEPDWAFVKDVSEIEFQSLEPVRSRTRCSDHPSVMPPADLPTTTRTRRRDECDRSIVSSLPQCRTRRAQRAAGTAVNDRCRAGLHETASSRILLVLRYS